MKRSWVLGIWALLALPCSAQQIMYSNLKELVEDRGDTVTILKVEKRSKNQIYLMGGADYRIEAEDNSGLCRYLKSRCYAVRIDTSLYVNCRKMRYKRYRFGGWYAPAMWVKGKIYYCAQPVGQVAASTATPPDATKLGGEVGDAINASGLVFARVYYELNPETGRSEFVGRKKILELLAGYPELKEAFEKETSESSEVIGKYLRQLESEPTCSTEEAQALVGLTQKAKEKCRTLRRRYAEADKSAEERTYTVCVAGIALSGICGCIVKNNSILINKIRYSIASAGIYFYIVGSIINRYKFR